VRAGAIETWRRGGGRLGTGARGADEQGEDRRR